MVHLVGWGSIVRAVLGVQYLPGIIATLALVMINAIRRCTHLP